jgi:hypothetical protein
MLQPSQIKLAQPRSAPIRRVTPCPLFRLEIDPAKVKKKQKALA